ncbi:MAG: hypothetical protein RSB58_09255 [Clostridium sp.]
MAQKRDIKIANPRGYIYTTTSTVGSMSVRLKWASGFAPKKKADFTKAQEFVDSECIRYMNPLTPRLSGLMIKSGTLGTVVGSGDLEYLVPYARRQYYEHKTKGRWFERMKASHKEPILKGATIIATGK